MADIKTLAITIPYVSVSHNSYRANISVVIVRAKLPFPPHLEVSLSFSLTSYTPL